MSIIIYQTDKRIGVTYAYESTAYWDKEKKQSRAKRKLIGKVEPETGQIVPTDSRNRIESPKVSRILGQGAGGRQTPAANEAAISARREPAPEILHVHVPSGGSYPIFNDRRM